MKIFQQTLSLATHAPLALIDITEQASELVSQSGVYDGLATLISAHTTAFINVNEREAMLEQDMIRFLEALAPADRDYLHNRTAVDGRNNAHAHLLGLFMSASVTIPIKAGRLLLGTWQSIFFIELDGPRARRQIHIHILGQAEPAQPTPT